MSLFVAPCYFPRGNFPAASTCIQARTSLSSQRLIIFGPFQSLLGATRRCTGRLQLRSCLARFGGWIWALCRRGLAEGYNGAEDNRKRLRAMGKLLLGVEQVFPVAGRGVIMMPEVCLEAKPL